jgi:hypothetical protein
MLGTNDTPDLFRQTYLRGLAIFFYGLIWLIGMLAGYLSFDSLFAARGLAITLVVATLASALAGGIGGATAMLTRLYQAISIRQDFQQQSIIRYLLLPVIGLGAGILALYVIAIPAALLINFARSGIGVLNELLASPSLTGIQILLSLIRTLFTEILASPTFVAIEILLGWMAGFYRQEALTKIMSPAQPTLEQQQAPGLDEDSPFYFKAWFAHRQYMIRWSYTWGLFLFFYAIAWFIGLLAGFNIAGGALSGLESSRNIVAAGLIMAAWPVAAAGGLGGVFRLLRDLYEHISDKQDFHRQHLMSYLVQPIIGFVLGLVMYFLFASGYLSFDSLFDGESSAEVIDSQGVVMLLLLLGWIAGFCQRTVTDLVWRLIQYLVSLFKLFARPLNPANLSNQEKREAILADIAKQTDFFPSVQEDTVSIDPRLWPTE